MNSANRARLQLLQNAFLEIVQKNINSTSTAAQPLQPVDCKTCSSTDKTLIKDFKNLFEDKNFADFTFTVDGTEFPVHKVIISARCAVFAAMLRHDMKEKQENRAVISDISAACFKEMLRFIYTGDIVVVSFKLAGELCKAADKYDLAELKKCYENKLIRGLTCENAVATLRLANSFSFGELKNRTMKYIQENKVAVVKTKGWIDLVSTNTFAKVVWDVCSVSTPGNNSSVAIVDSKNVMRNAPYSLRTNPRVAKHNALKSSRRQT